MGLWIGGPSNNQVEVDSGYKALVTSVRPTDYVGTGITGGKVTGGLYRICVYATHTGAFAANGDVFAFRWAHPTLNAVVWYVKFGYMAKIIAITAVATLSYGLYFCRNYITNSSAGTAVTFVADYYKKMTKVANTGLSLGDCRYATGAVLTAGTLTADSQPLAYLGGYAAVANPSGVTSKDIYPVNMETEQSSPVVLMANEGLHIRSITNYANSHTIYFWVEMAWSEVPFGVF